MVEIGQEAPDFTLKDQDANEVTLSNYRGSSAVALVFYPFTFTAVCEGELCQIRDDLTQFAAKGVQVLTVSCDTRPSQKRWADEQGYTFPVMSDYWPHGGVAKSYGVFNELVGCANRATFLIDINGTIVDRFETGSLGEARDPQRYRAVFAML